MSYVGKNVFSVGKTIGVLRGDASGAIRGYVLAHCGGGGGVIFMSIVFFSFRAFWKIFFFFFAFFGWKNELFSRMGGTLPPIRGKFRENNWFNFEPFPK